MASTMLQRRLVWGGIAVAAVVAGAFWALRAAPAATPPGVDPWAGPAPVRTVPALRGTFVQRVGAIGTVTPLNVVTVRPRVDGPLARVLFEEGQVVAAGQPLAEVDPAVYRVRVAQAEGQHAQNAALLANAQADLAMYERLVAQDAVARQVLDKHRALVAQLVGTQKADQATVDNARLQLAWTRIVAPIAGRTGLRRVDAGNLIAATDTQGLVTIAQTRPISVTFSLPEASVTALRAAHARGRPLVVEAWDRTETRRLAAGQLATFDNQIDAATGTLKLKARFDNGDDMLFPNQYVKVRLTLGERADAVTIPADAVQHGAQGPHAYIVAAGKAVLRPLKLGASQDDRIEVIEGLADGDAVVLEGLDRLKDGREVVVVKPASRG